MMHLFRGNDYIVLTWAMLKHLALGLARVMAYSRVGTSFFWRTEPRRVIWTRSLENISSRYFLLRRIDFSVKIRVIE